MRYELTRDVSRKECPWLDRDLKKGELVSRYEGVTYGCIGAGIACSWDGKNPFFEVPRDALSQHQ